MRLLDRTVTTYHCDRCKKVFAESKVLEKADAIDTSVKRGVAFQAPVVEDGHVAFKERDLCGDCTAEFHRWMTEPPKKRFYRPGSRKSR